MNPYYQDDYVQLYNGDCLEVLPSLSNLFDACVTDPPYGTTACKWDVVIPFTPMWTELLRLCKNNAPILLFGSQPFSSTLVMSNPKLFRYDWIWEKTEASGHLNSKKMPMRAHESVLVFYSKPPTYNPIKTNGHIRKQSRAERFRLQSECYRKQSGVTVYDSTERYPRSIIKYSTDKQIGALHPTQKPVELLRYLIRTYTNIGEIVLDFACGSGTTLLAARLEGRRAVGIELDKDYCEVAVKRLKT